MVFNFLEENLVVKNPAHKHCLKAMQLTQIKWAYKHLWRCALCNSKFKVTCQSICSAWFKKTKKIRKIMSMLKICSNWWNSKERGRYI